MEEYVDSVIIDMSKREFKLFSSKGDERIIKCETYDQFLSVLKVIRDRLNEDMIFYTKPNVAA